MRRDEPANEHRVRAIDANLISAVEVCHGNSRQILERDRRIEQLGNGAMLRESARSLDRIGIHSRPLPTRKVLDHRASITASLVLRSACKSRQGVNSLGHDGHDS